MRVTTVLFLLFHCQFSWSREFGIYFLTEDSFVQTSYVTVCDETEIKFEILINRTSGVIFHAENKVKAVKLIVYFERPGVYMNVTDGIYGYNLPLTLDFFSNQWLGWHDITIKISQHMVQLVFDSAQRRIDVQGRYLFPEDVVEENEVYFGASPSWTNIGNVTRFSGFMRNLKYKSCGCKEWRQVKVMKTFNVSLETQGECTPNDACKRDCVCYLFQWGGNRCECPEERCTQSSDSVSFHFNRDDVTSSRLQPYNATRWSASVNGPFGNAMSIESGNSVQLHVTKGRTCFRSVYLCENGFVHSFWLLSLANHSPGRSALILKHALSLDSSYGLSVTRVDDRIHVSLVTRDGRRYNVHAPLTLSVWTLVTITFNQSHVSLYTDSHLRYSDAGSTTDVLNSSSSTRFIFLGDNRSNPHVLISSLQFSSDPSSHSLTAVNELWLSQIQQKRETSRNCPINVDMIFVNMAECFRLAFGTSKFGSFYVLLVVKTLLVRGTILVQSSLINIVAESSNVILIEIIGLSVVHRVVLSQTGYQFSYLEISFTESGGLTVTEGLDTVLLNATVAVVTRTWPMSHAVLRINSDHNTVRLVRIINADRSIASRTRRVLIDATQYSEDFDTMNVTQMHSLNLTNAYIGHGLLLMHPRTNLSTNWFNTSCIRYLDSCYHGLTLSMRLKILHGIQESSDVTFRVFSSGRSGVSMYIGTTGLYFHIVTNATTVTTFLSPTAVKPVNEWQLLEMTISQNGIPFLYVNRQEAQRMEYSKTQFSSECDGICIGDSTDGSSSIALLLDEIQVWDVERDFLYVNEYIYTGPSAHKLISFTKHQLNRTFTMRGSAKVILTTSGYALALNNFGARSSLIDLLGQPKCLWNYTKCRRGALIRVRLRPDNLALSHQTILANAAVTVTINLEYVSVQWKAHGRIWVVICKDLLQLFVWHTLDVSWHRDRGLRTYINGRLSGYARQGTVSTAGLPKIDPLLYVGIDYVITRSINYATLVIDDVELFEGDRSSLAYETHPIDDLLSCAIAFSFDDSVKATVPLVLGIVGSAGLFNATAPGSVKIHIPSCFYYPITRCTMCFTLRLWVHIDKADLRVLHSSLVSLSILRSGLRVAVQDGVKGQMREFFCQYDEIVFLRRWNFVEVSWDEDEGLLVFVNREGVVCEARFSDAKTITGSSDYLEVAKEFVGVLDEIELYRARVSVLYWSRVLSEAQSLALIERIKEKERFDKEVTLLKMALNSGNRNRTVEVVDSLQVNGTNYVSYKLPKNAYTYIPGGKEEVEISFKSFNSAQSSIIWVSDSLLSKNTLTLKNRKLYFTKVYILPASNTSRRLTEEIAIHNNILPNVVYNVVIYQRAGEIVMKTTSVNQSNTQSMIGRDALLPLDSDIYFGGYNDMKFLKVNQINSSLSGVIYKARLKPASSKTVIDIMQEMAAARQNPDIGNHGNVIVLKKIIRPDMAPAKTSFLATLSPVKVPLMISSFGFSLAMPRWDFTLLSSLEIEFSTLESRGLLLFIGNKTDFISLEIFDSKLFFIYKYNRILKRIATHDGSITVSDNKAYRIYVGRDLSGYIKVYFNRDEVNGGVMRLEEVANAVSVIGHLGKYESWPDEIFSRVSFVGCVHFARINDADYVNFSRKSALMNYEDKSTPPYPGRQPQTPYRADRCEAALPGSCDNSPCAGGWCQPTTISALGQLRDNFKCNCLLSSKSLDLAFTNSSPIENLGTWINQYLLQFRSLACTRDTNQLVIVPASFFTVTFHFTFPFVSVLDLEFLILVRSVPICALEIAMQQRRMSIIITNGKLLINIGHNNILALADVGIDDNQWYGVQIQIRLQYVRVSIGNIQKESTSPLIPALNVSMIKVGNCAGYVNSHFKIKGLSYNGLNVLNTVSSNESSLFYSSKYHYPVIRDIDSNGQGIYIGGQPVTLLNHFHHAITLHPITISWSTQLSIRLVSSHPGIILHIINGGQTLSWVLCRDNVVIFLHRDHLKKSRIERVPLNGVRLEFKLTLDLIRHTISLQQGTSIFGRILRLGMDTWDVGDVVNVQFGLLNTVNDWIDFDEFAGEDRLCLEEGIRSPVMGCLENFLWSDGNSTVSFTENWNGIMTSSPSDAVVVGQCKVVSKCLPDTCVHGQCTSTDYVNLHCNCSGTEFTGQRCHVARDRCREHVCQHGGLCVPTKDYEGVDTVYCNCTGTGYEGRRCEDVTCPVDYCQHSGRCHSAGDSRFCNCSETSFIGARCSVPVCKPRLCLGRGRCELVSNHSAPVCHCQPGFFGDHCEEESLGKCEGRCHHEGVCSRYRPIFKLCSNRYCRRSSTYKCNCDHTFFRGDFCEGVESGFIPIADGTVVMENVTFERENYLRILFELGSPGNSQTTLITALHHDGRRLIILVDNGAVLLKRNPSPGHESTTKVLGPVTNINVLLLADRGSRVDFYLNNVMDYVEFEDWSQNLTRRSKRSSQNRSLSYPAVTIGCNEAMLNCFDGLIAGIIWNDRHLLSAENSIFRNGKQQSIKYLQIRRFPKQDSVIVLPEKKLGHYFLITASVVMVIFLFTFYISMKLWRHSCIITKAYVRDTKCIRNGRYNHNMPIDSASEMALITPEQIRQNYVSPDLSPELPSHGDHGSKLTVLSMSSSISSEMEYYRILLVSDIPSVHKLKVIDFTPVPDNQIVVVTNFLPEIKISKCLFPVDQDDKSYKCVKVRVSPCGHYLYCHMTLSQTVEAEEYEIQAWRISNGYELLTRPPNVTFTHSSPFADDSYRLVLLNRVTCMLFLFDVEVSTTLWSRAMAHCSAMIKNPLVMLDGSVKLIVKKDHSLEVVDLSSGILLNTYRAPTGTSFRQVVGTDYNKLIILTTNYDIYHWDMVKEEYDHKQLPIRVTLVERSTSSRGCKVAFGLETGEVYVSSDEEGIEYSVLGPRNDKTILSMRFSADGALLAAGFENNLVHVWRLESGVSLCHFHAVHERGLVLDLRFMSNHRTLLVLVGSTNQNRSHRISKKLLTMTLRNNTK